MFIDMYSYVNMHTHIFNASTHVHRYVQLCKHAYTHSIHLHMFIDMYSYVNMHTHTYSIHLHICS